MYRSLLIAVLSIAILADEARGQLEPSYPISLLSDAARAEMSAGTRSAGRSFLERALYAAGGAVVGAGLGYFTSQVVYSDWDKSSNGSFVEQRRLYAVSGATVGAVAGIFIGGGRAGARAASPSAAGLSALEGVETISREEIVETGAATAYQVVESLRPDWFLVRGAKSIFEQGQMLGDEQSPSTIPGTPQIITYLDNARLGGVDDLRRIPALDLESIIRLSPAQAAMRLGPGHPHGAIIASIGFEE